MKVYEAVFNDELGQGVYGISLVENPAMEDHWITLSEQPQELQFSAVDDAKQLLLGAVLIPNKKIYRNVDGHEFYITFKDETITKLAHDWMRKGMQNNSSAEHEIKLTGVSFVESWQVEDPKTDKSALYGKEYEKGTWVTMAKVSPEIYEQAKEGTFKGFSVDAMLKLQELKLKSDISEMETKMDWKDFFKGLFSAKEETSVEQIEVKEEELSPEVLAEAKDAEVVDKSTDAMKEALTEGLTDFMENINARFSKMEATIKGLKSEKEEAEKKVEEMQVELNKQPETKAVKPAPVETSTKPVFKIAQNRRKGTQDIVNDYLFGTN